MVTVTTQPTVKSSLSMFLDHALKELEGMGILLCLKPHPSELDTWRSSYANLLNDSRVRVILDKDVDLYELLIASDLHVTVCSTVFLECFSLGVPNIIAKCPGYEFVFDVVSNGEVLVAETPADFAMLVRKFMESPWYRHQIIWQGKQIGAKYFAIDGDPESNILSQIQGVVC